MKMVTSCTFLQNIMISIYKRGHCNCMMDLLNTYNSSSVLATRHDPELISSQGGSYQIVNLWWICNIANKLLFYPENS